MIMIGPLIQATFTTGYIDTSTTLIPYPFFVGGKWVSTVNSVETGLQVQESIDSGLSYPVIDPNTITNESGTFNPTIFGGNIAAYITGIWVNWRVNGEGWQQRDLGSVPNANMGGGLLSFISYANGEFIIVKNSSFGVDLYATADFLTFRTPSGSFNLIEDIFESSLFTVRYINGQYLGFGYETNQVRVAYSPNLIDWTLDVTILPYFPDSYTNNMAYYNGKYYIHHTENLASTETSRILHILSSTDGITWVEVALTNAINEGIEWFVTTTAIELLTKTHVIRSTDGTNWTEELLIHWIPAMAESRGFINGEETAPDTIKIPYGIVAQDGGKIIDLTSINAAPTSIYPATSKYNEIMGFMIPQRGYYDTARFESPYALFEEGFLSRGKDVNNRDDPRARSFYARNTGQYYFEYTLRITQANSQHLIGARILGDKYYTGINETEVSVRYNTIVKALGNVAVTYTPTENDIIGFLFDFSAATIIIEVNGVLLHTATGIETGKTWSAYTEMYNPSSGTGTVYINVGQEAFIHNGTGAIAWKD